ncbi:39S ribosomal protein L41, mitochondrial [Lutzomyia longipalpis]|uniref:39S ribosomal protein L41, mitochondrial n=1 Tax=Lutzomyia longipalpis TaxID=7200 RepID=UPI0024836DED|nr:39S ribosomal protein L41, mitochondrial [Lutzomyia longipalpis]
MLRKVPSVLVCVSRSIHTTPSVCGNRNFRKFPLYNKRGTRIYKQQRRENLPFCLPIYKYGVRDTGEVIDNVYHEIPEMIPELIVPDLKDCQLKPYVSYKTQEVFQSEFTSEDLFNAVYSKKIIEDFKNSALREDGTPVEPSPEELKTPEEAFIEARKTGSDIF